MAESEGSGTNPGEGAPGAEQGRPATRVDPFASTSTGGGTPPPRTAPPESRTRKPGEPPEGFFGKLFDFSFSTFITVSLVKVLYALMLAGGALFVLIAVLGVMASDTAGGAEIVVTLIVAAMGLLFYTIFIRIWLESVIVMFRIAESTGETAHNTRHTS